MKIVVIDANDRKISSGCFGGTPQYGLCRTSEWDLASSYSIKKLFLSVSPFDAVVCATGLAKFGPLKELADSDFQFSLFNMLMGQVNLVRIGLSHIADRGSFTLTCGVLSQGPMPGSAAINLVNYEIEGFVHAAGLEMPRGVRINVVSPPWVKETLEAMGMDSSSGMPAAMVAKAFVESVEGVKNGAVIDASTID